MFHRQFYTAQNILFETIFLTYFPLWKRWRNFQTWEIRVARVDSSRSHDQFNNLPWQFSMLTHCGLPIHRLEVTLHSPTTESAAISAREHSHELEPQRLLPGARKKLYSKDFDKNANHTHSPREDDCQARRHRSTQINHVFPHYWGRKARVTWSKPASLSHTDAPGRITPFHYYQCPNKKCDSRREHLDRARFTALD